MLALKTQSYNLIIATSIRSLTRSPPLFVLVVRSPRAR
jgi:hypothetical protein